ncbi:hypothetical protein H4219_001001 [Mycoemilia scoparia]|uniref:Acetyl-coenzyme A transporter 1 n=1 Tax=Mycoemilia scoparia TaxID=417184 RepID=A0A9W8A4I8_9FUNG|nr:hypothetical protein H4219_001001 [Mycoemilia scoparia]
MTESVTKPRRRANKSKSETNGYKDSMSMLDGQLGHPAVKTTSNGINPNLDKEIPLSSLGAVSSKRQKGKFKNGELDDFEGDDDVQYFGGSNSQGRDNSGVSYGGGSSSSNSSIIFDIPRIVREFKKSMIKFYNNKDFSSIMLLIILYWLQGIPLGLSGGSIPFLLKEKLSYTEIAVFTLAGYPYSVKLFWSPIVDCLYNPKVGRRKSWIIPIQFLIALLFLCLGGQVEALMQNPADNIGKITAFFLTIVILSATQDVAVDGWALTLLSEENLSYASTCQTIGLNCGYFLSFTGQDTEEDLGIVGTYKTIWKICKLRHMMELIAVLMICKIGFIPNDAVTQLKLVEKGLHKEDMALAVLIDFPIQIIFGYYAAHWSQGKNAITPWRHAYMVRVFFCFLGMMSVYWFPEGQIMGSYFYFILFTKIAASMSSTVQFVGICAFFTQIADPVIGGTYMTLVNTLSNFGGTWPVYFVMESVDWFTDASCSVTDHQGKSVGCLTETDKNLCSSLGGRCNTTRDGYYIVSLACLSMSVVLFYAYIKPTVLKLESLSPQVWRVVL